MSYSETLDKIRTMSLQDRINLVQAIWDDIAAEQGETRLSDAQKQELDRRLAAYESNPDNVISWEQVKAEAEERLRK